MPYTAITHAVPTSQRSTFGWFLLATSLLVTSQTAHAQTTPIGGQNAPVVRAAAKQLGEADSIARVTHRKPDMMRIDKINPATPHSGLFIITSAAGAVEELPALASGGGLVGLIEAVEKQLASTPAMKDKAPSEMSVYAMLTIGADGKVQQTSIVEGQDAIVNAAVIAAIQHLPRLAPGQVAGTAVPVKLTIPVQVKS